MEKNQQRGEENPKRKRPSLLRVAKHQLNDLTDIFDEQLKVLKGDNSEISSTMVIEQPK
jgi:hypothetical protein